MEPIGIIDSLFQQKFGIPRQGSLVPQASGTVQLNQQRVSPGCIDGFEPGDFIWLIFKFHKSQASTKGKIKPPRLKGESLGVFASRSPHRPNPLGMTLCQITQIDALNLSFQVQGIDLLDGTPILDIKPYVAYADSPQTKPSDHWRHQAPKEECSFSISDSAQTWIQENKVPKELVELALKCAAYDPRAYHQKTTPAHFWLQVGDFDFGFIFDESNSQLQSVKKALSC